VYDTALEAEPEPDSDSEPVTDAERVEAALHAEQARAAAEVTRALDAENGGGSDSDSEDGDGDGGGGFAAAAGAAVPGAMEPPARRKRGLARFLAESEVRRRSFVQQLQLVEAGGGKGMDAGVDPTQYYQDSD
jgi:hypothetical protein